MSTGYATSTGDPAGDTRGSVPVVDAGGDVVRASVELEATLDAARAARVFLKTTLAAWELDGVTDVTTLLGNELVTNAVVHARTALRLAVSYRRSELTVEVWDHSAAAPVLGPAHLLEATRGRGLVLVESLADRWGVRSGDGQKIVWFALRVS